MYYFYLDKVLILHFGSCLEKCRAENWVDTQSIHQNVLIISNNIKSNLQKGINIYLIGLMNLELSWEYKRILLSLFNLYQGVALSSLYLNTNYQESTVIILSFKVYIDRSNFFTSSSYFFKQIPILILCLLSENFLTTEIND